MDEHHGQGPQSFEDQVRQMMSGGGSAPQKYDASSNRPTVRLPPPGSYQQPHAVNASPPFAPNGGYPGPGPHVPPPPGHISHNQAQAQSNAAYPQRLSQKQRRMQTQAQYVPDTTDASGRNQRGHGYGRGQAPYHRTQHQQPPLDPNAFHRGGQIRGYYQQPPQPQRQLFDPRAQRGPPPMMQPDWRVRQAQYLDHVAATELSEVEMSQAEHDEKEAFRFALEQVIQTVCAEDPERLPHVTLECFGSFKSGFASAGSDMDLVIVLQDGTPYTACFSLLEDDLPRVLEKRLLQLGYGARLLTRTRVPIIKICEKPDDNLLDKLRQEREKWDSLPNEQKYPHLHQNEEADDEAEVVHDTNGSAEPRAENAEAAAVLSTGDAKFHSTSTDGSSATDINRVANGNVDPETAQRKDDPATENGAKGDAKEQSSARGRREPAKPWTRERKAGPLDFPKSGIGIQSDINFFNPLGLHNTQLLRCYSLCDPRVRSMVLVVKAWAKRRKINSSYSGTLSSYGYVLMVLHYLTNIAQPPVLPNLQLSWRPNPQCTPAGNGRAEVDGWTVDFWRNEDEITEALRRDQMSSNREPLGSLLAGFFQYYSSQGGFPQFHWMGDVLSLRTAGGIIAKADKGWVKAVTEEGEGKKVQHRYLFCIEDPFELSHNVARTVTHQGIVAIRDEFRRARRILQAVGNGQVPHDGELFAQLVEVDQVADAVEGLNVSDANEPLVKTAAQAQFEQAIKTNGTPNHIRATRNRHAQQQDGALKTSSPAQASKRLNVTDNDDFPSLSAAKPKPAKGPKVPVIHQSEISGARAREYLEELKRKKAEASAEQTATVAAESVLGGDD